MAGHVFTGIGFGPIQGGLFVAEAFRSGHFDRIEVFVEKDDLLPFEEAKLYGHNAIHALLAYLGALQGCRQMTEVQADAELMRIAREAFLHESGTALIRKHGHLGDRLFTPAGYRDFAEDLLTRMTNPYSGDTVARAGRDPVRKLGYHDRIFGAMLLALAHGIEPINMALGAAAGIAALLAVADEHHVPDDLRVKDWRTLDGAAIERILRWLWQQDSDQHAAKSIHLVQAAHSRLLA